MLQRNKPNGLVATAPKNQGAYNTDPAVHEGKEKLNESDDECAASDPYNSIYYQGMEEEEDNQEEAKVNDDDNCVMEVGHVHAHNFQPVQEQHKKYHSEFKAHETISKWNYQTMNGSKSPPEVKNTLQNIIKYNDKKCLICDTFFT
ncbi:hypothetical protein HI914_00717 [Erysiphe necator]|nr:hypothetical protein HI914_00717 [Erysiphe necator]